MEQTEKKEKKSLKNNLKFQENLLGWIYISPMIIGIIVFTAIPLVMSIMAMFYEWDGIKSLPESTFVGFKHFKSIFGGINTEVYWKSLGNTLKFSIQLPISLILGMFLALAMNREMRGVQTFRVIYYLPGVMSIVAVAIVWNNLFKFDGTINNMFYPEGEGVKWLTSNGGITFTVNLLLIWKGVGYSTLMLIAGLQSVSTDQIEAARIDGANSWIILVKITFPALYPIMFYLFVTGLMGSMQMFNEAFILLPGGYGVNNYGMTAVSFVYYFFGESNLGLASVGAWMLAFIIFLITAVQMFVDKKKREAD